MKMRCERPSYEQEAKPGQTVPLMVLSTGEQAFEEIVRCLAEARGEVLIRCFVWRDDATGNLFARKVLEAADRGVKITIFKDRVGAVYEHFDHNKMSFFHKKLDPGDRFKVEFLCFVYSKGRPRPQQPNPLAEKICSHPNIVVHHTRKLYNHSKIFIFDNETMIVGGMGIGDDFRSEWLDLMIKIEGRSHVQRYVQRIEGKLSQELARPVGFLVNCWHPGGGLTFDTLPRRLLAIARVEKSLVMEMAYLGDGRITDALVDLVNRGCSLTIVVSARANVVNDLNLWVLSRIMRRTGCPDRLRIFLHPQMVHTKLMIYDEKIVQIGSTNCTPLSHDGFAETDLWVEDAAFASSLVRLVESHAGSSTQITQEAPTNLIYVVVEWIIQQWQRTGPGTSPPPL